LFVTHQVLVYANDVNLIDDVRTIKRKTEVSLIACKEIGLAVNTRKTKYMEVGSHRVLMANEYIAIGSNSYEKMKTFKYSGFLLTNRNSIHEEIKYRLQAGNLCYYSVQTCCLLNFSLRI
jgi:hypothetical protein